MPDANGKFYFSDYVVELKARGFDGFSDADLKVLINRGYFAVARKSRWEWERQIDTFTLAPGAMPLALWPTVGGEMPYFRSLDKLYVTTFGQRKRLKVALDDDFFVNWLALDLTASSARGEPIYYYIYENQLYVLPPPVTSRDFIAHYHRRMVALAGDMDQPITPQHLDEAIVVASLIRCHQRSNEVNLASMAQMDLEEFFDDMRDDEEKYMEEQPSRVRPDDSWL
jgi:hypothetical protein